MKKIFLLFLLCVTCATSCKKDDDQIYDVIIFTGEAVEVVTEADLDDLDNSNLETAVKTAFGTDYRLSQMPLRIKVIGTISSADFETLNYFDEIDLSQTQIVGEIQVGRVVGTPGFGTSVSEQWVTGNAIPMSAFINNTKLSRITLASGIPATVDDTFEEGFQAMTYVGVSAFSGCTSLEAINGLESITDVGSAAFKGCSMLGEDDKVLFGEYLVTLGDNAFADCSLLYEIDLEKASMGLSIGATAFSNCSALYSVVLPNNLAALGSEAFSGCDALESIVAKMGDGVSNSDNVTVPTLLAGVIPDQFKASKTNAKIVTIEDVAMPAYSDAGGWSDYNLQASATNGWKIVYNEADEDNNTVNNLAASLKGVYGSNYASNTDLKVKVSGTMNQADFTALYTGFNSVDLSDVTVVGSITIGSSYTTTKASAETTQVGNAIPASVFSGTKSTFKNFTIPKSVTFVGDAAFEGNESLEELDLDTDTDVYLTIGSAAFRNIKNLGGDTGIFGLKSTTASTTLVIPANVGEIRDYAFAGTVSEKLETIEMRGDKSAPTIGENAFPDKFKATATGGTMLVPVAAAGLYNTTAWKEYSRNKVDFEEDDYGTGVEVEPHCVTNVANESDNTVANIEEQLIAVFGSTYAMEDEIIVSGTLNNADFEYLRTFKDVDIRDVKIVGTTLSAEGVTSAMAIPSYAFCGSSSGRNYNLERIVLPTAVGELSTYSLAYCPNLKTIIFPEGMEITAVGTYSFRGCAIEEFPGVTGKDATYYDNTDNTGLINLPRRATYSTGLFYDCTSLHTVDFSDGFDDLTGVNQAMFQGCTNLSSVTLPEDSSSFLYIYTLAFYGCTNLDGITIPESVKYLGDRSFYNCTSLTSIDIPKAVVGALSSSLTLSGTFYGCESLVKVTVNWDAEVLTEDDIENGEIQSATPPAIITYDMNTNYPTFPTAFYGTDATRYITLNGGGEDLYKNISGWSGINTLEASGDNVLSVEAGGLGAALTTAYSLASRVPNTLALSGELNPSDLDYINGKAASVTGVIDCTELNIEILDLSSVTFVDGSDPATEYNYVPESAFSGNEKLKIVTLPTSGIEKVSKSAFSGCTSLEIVVVPSTATEIDESAFENCSSLTSISLPNVTTIGTSAFSGCSSLASVALSQKIETIGDAAFKGAAITSMVMPASITEIAEELFSGCTKLSDVTLSSATTSIGESAFSGCSSMTSITIPKSVATIGASAFASCEILSSVTFESLTDTDNAPALTIGANAFDSCISMKLFSMPTNAGTSSDTLKDNIFNNCSSLTKIKVYWESDAEPAVSATTFPSTFKTDSNAGTIVLPEGVSSYSATGWDNYNVAEAADDTVNTTPGGLEAAILSKWRDFYNMTNDTYPSITVTGSINSTDFAALQLSTTSSDGTILDHSFKTIDLSDCLIQNNTIPSGAFFENTTLGDLTLPESITTIESTAFQGCTNLLSFSFPTSLSSIGSYAFAGTRLVEVTGLRNLTSLGSYAFYACDILSNVDLSYSTQLTTTIYTTYFFYNCTSLTKVVLPDNLSILPEYTFYGCSSLTSVTMPSELTYIGERAFQNCTSLESIDIPATVVTIENDSSGCDTFSGCSKLSTVTLNWTEVSAIPTIYADAFPSQFLGSSKNKSFSIPSALTEADYQSVSGWSTFSFETGGANTLTLTGGSLQNAVESKWGGAWDSSIPSEIIVEGTADYSDLIKWSEITSTNSVKLGACVTSLDMSGVKFTGTDIPSGFWGDWVYTDTSNNVISKSASAYKLKTLILPSFITEISEEAFKGLATLTSITMDGVETIGESAFENCIGLTTIDFADPLTTIGKSAFKNATGLTSFSTPTRTATDTDRHNITIGESAFEGCVLLSSAALNLGVMSIDENSFKDCKTLTIISLPTTLKSVNAGSGVSTYDSPFTNCSALSVIEVSWSAIPTLTGFADNTFPAEFLTNGSAYVYAPDTFVTAVSKATTDPWYSYNVGAKSDDMVQSTAGNLATVIALKGNSLSDKITIFGSINADDFATLASSTFTTIDMKSVNITGVVTVEGTVSSLGNAIPTEGFKGNTYLKNITLPTSMAQIGSSAFYGCTALATITSGADIVYVGSDAFSGCSSLSIGKFTDLFASTTYIGGNAFSGVTIDEVDIPSTLALGETSSFFGCNAGKIVLPWCYGADDNNATSDDLKAPAKISSTTFPVRYSSSGYANLEFDASVISAASTSTEDAYNSLANYSEGWSSFRFAENVKTSSDDSYIVINEVADANDKTNNTLADAISKVSAFYTFQTTTSTYPKIIVKGQMNQADFTSLLRFAEVDLSGVEIVGEICVTPTTSSATATYASETGWVSAIPAYAFACLPDGTSVDTADGGDMISTTANPTGSGNGILTKITLPLACQAIGQGAFLNCTAVTEVVFPDGMDLRYIYSYGLSRMTALTSVTNIPSTLYYMGWGALQTNTKMVTADFSTASDALTMGGAVFSGCTVLANTSLPSGYAASIPSTTYQTCAMYNFTIPAGTTSLATNSFKNITELESIDIPESVTSITSTAFYGCTGLKRISANWTSSIPSVTYDSETPANSTFPVQFHNGSGEDVRILVPEGCEALYKAAWPNFSDCIESDVYDTINATVDSFNVPSTWTGSSAPSTIYIKGKMTSDHFLELKSVKSAKIDLSGVTSVAAGETTAENTVCAGAFTGNLNVSTILLPSCITAIGESAFDGCTNLVPEDMTDIMTSIGSRAYAGTQYSADIVLPLSLTEMGSDVFDGCTITSITTPWYDDTLLNGVPKHTVATITATTFPELFRTDVGTSSIDVPAVVDLTGDMYKEWAANYNLECLPSDTFTVASKTGELAEALSSIAIESINPLTITGVMSEDDFITSSAATTEGWSALRDFISKNGLKYIDLSGVTLDSSLGGALPAEVFKDLTTLTTISLPSSVVTISDSAFEGCTSLTSVTWATPAGSASIGASAFKGCSKLGSADALFNINLTSVGESAFEGCTLLTSLTLSDGVTSYGANAFAGCDAITSITAADAADATSVATVDATTFPSEFLSGGSYSITVPSTTTYASWAAYNLVASGSVAAANATLYITCTSTADAAPSTSSDSDCASAYLNYTYDQGTLEAAIRSAGYGTDFDNGTVFKKLVVSGNINVGDFAAMKGRFKSIDMTNAVVVGYMQSSFNGGNQNGNGIPYYAFNSDTVIEELWLPNTVTTVCPQAVRYASNLRFVHFPVSVVKVQSSSFDSCSSLETVSIESGSKWTTQEQLIFGNTTSLKSFTIPENFTILGAQMFLNSGLTSIDIPASVTTFNTQSSVNQQFYGCSNLDLITTHWVGGDEPTMLADAFPAEYMSGGSKDIYVPANDYYDYVITKYRTDDGLGLFGLLNVGDVRVESFTLYCDSTVAGGSASTSFATQVSSANSTLLTKGEDDRYVTILGSLNANDFATLAAATAFENIDMSLATSLETATLYGTNKAAAIPTNAFNGNTTLKGITLPTSVYKVDDSAFNGCTALTSVVLPDNGYGMTYIGASAFEGCTSLLSLSNGAMVREIGEKAFYGCEALESIGADDTCGLNISGLYASSKNRGAGIGSDAFDGCENLNYVYLPWSSAADMPAIAKDFLPEYFEELYAWSDTSDIRWIRVPDGAVETYSSDEVMAITEIASVYWMAGLNDPQPGQVTTATLEGTLLKVVNLASDAGTNDAVPVTGTLQALATGVENWGDATSISISGLINSADFTWLKGQTQFTSIDLSSAVLKGNFYYDSASNKADFTIPVNAFKSCSNLTEFVFPANVFRVGDSAFDGTGLTSLTLPSTMQVVGDSAFANCSSLNSITVEFGSAAAVSVTSTSFPSEYLANTGSKMIVIPFGEAASDYTTLTAYYNVIEKPADVKLEGTTLYITDVNSVELTNSDTGDYSYLAQNLAHIALTGQNSTYPSYDGVRDVATEHSGLSAAADYAISVGVLDADYLDTVTNIVVTGNINAADYSYLYGRFENIDLSTAIFVGYGANQGGKNPYVSCVPTYAFNGDSKLRSFKMPETTDRLCYSLFTGSGLESIVIPDSVTTTQWGAFKDASSLLSVTIGKNAITYGGMIYDGCAATSIVLTWDVTATLSITDANILSLFPARFDNGGTNYLTIPAGATGMGPYAQLAVQYQMVEAEETADDGDGDGDDDGDDE